MEQKNKDNNKNQNQPKKWEIYYGFMIMLFMGFWIGFIFRGSSSWAVPILLEHDFVSNFAVVLASLPVLYIVISLIVSHYEKKKQSSIEPETDKTLLD